MVRHQARARRQGDKILALGMTRTVVARTITSNEMLETKFMVKDARLVIIDMLALYSKAFVVARPSRQRRETNAGIMLKHLETKYFLYKIINALAALPPWRRRVTIAGTC